MRKIIIVLSFVFTFFLSNSIFASTTSNGIVESKAEVVLIENDKVAGIEEALAVKETVVIVIITLTSCNAQVIKVTYTEKMDLNEKLKSVKNPMIKQMIIEKTGKPKYYELLSHNGSSIYHKQNIEEDNLDNGVTVIGTGGEDIIYKNHVDRIYIKQTNFMSRTFLIKDTLGTKSWKIMDETKKIGDYQCKKAILKEKDKEIIAWFTEEVPSNEGPRDFYGLPGLILKVETGTSIIEATNISISNNKIAIQIPAKGKKISLEAFEKIKKEKINNLTGGEQKGNGVQIIKM